MIKLVTFNLRTPSKQDGANYFPFRLPLIVEKITRERPDAIGFQELKEAGRTALQAMLPEYMFIGLHRNADLTGECCAVAFRRDSLLPCACDTFWLSDTPRIPGSRYADQSDCPRICTWAKFVHRESGAIFILMNTHLDHRAEYARLAGLRLVLETAKTLKADHGAPMFITGDFNCTPEESTYKLINEYGFTDITDGLGGTYHGFGQATPEKIDYILTDLPRERFKTSLWTDERDGLYLSDHHAIEADWDNA